MLRLLSVEAFTHIASQPTPRWACKLGAPQALRRRLDLASYEQTCGFAGFLQGAGRAALEAIVGALQLSQTHGPPAPKTAAHQELPGSQLHGRIGQGSELSNQGHVDLSVQRTALRICQQLAATAAGRKVRVMAIDRRSVVPLGTCGCAF